MKPKTFSFAVVYEHSKGPLYCTDQAMEINYRECKASSKFYFETGKLYFECIGNQFTLDQLSITSSDGTLLACIKGEWYSGLHFRFEPRRSYILSCQIGVRYEQMLMKEFERISQSPDELTDYFAKDGSDQLTIACEDKEWQISSELMAIRSPVFARMLEGAFKEAATKRHVIEDFPPETVGAMVECCATNGFNVCFISDENMLDLVRLADKYEIKHLMDVASLHVANKMTARNFLSTARFADKHNSKQLQKFCDVFNELMMCLVE